jgi:hypothetical protein
MNLDAAVVLLSSGVLLLSAYDRDRASLVASSPTPLVSTSGPTTATPTVGGASYVGTATVLSRSGSAAWGWGTIAGTREGLSFTAAEDQGPDYRNSVCQPHVRPSERENV